jgi:hypothetical protein
VYSQLEPIVPRIFGCLACLLMHHKRELKFSLVFALHSYTVRHCMKIALNILSSTYKSLLKLSVRKVVSTLTSTSTEIYLSMAGAKQLSDTSFILVPAGAVRPAGVCSRHCIARHRGACRGELQARWERRQCPQVPEV